MSVKTLGRQSIASSSLLVLFLILGLSKTGAFLFSTSDLLAKDPVFPQFQMRELIFVAGLAELLTAYSFIRNGNAICSYLCAAWVITPVMFYRISTIMLGQQNSCPCLGRVPEALGLKIEFVNLSTGIILAYIVSVSFYKLMQQFVGKAKLRYVKANTLVLLILGFPCCASSISAVEPKVVSISGTISLRYSSEFNEGAPLDLGFNVLIENQINRPIWLIKTFPLGGSSTSKAIEYSVAYFDGNSLFSFTKRPSTYDFSAPLREEFAKLKLLENNPKISNNAELSKQLQNELNKISLQIEEYSRTPPDFRADSAGIVSLSFFPVFDVSLSSPLWFAFCSKEHVQISTNSLFPFWYGGVSELKSRGTNVETRSLTKIGGLVKSADFSGIDGGGVELAYNVSSDTNLLNIAHPTKFTIERFTQSGGQIYVVDCVVKQAEIVKGHIELAEYHSLVTSVEDRRFIERSEIGRPLYYSASPIQSESGLTNSKSFKNAVSAKMVLNAKGNGYYWLKMILIAIFIVPIAFFLKQKGQK